MIDIQAKLQEIGPFIPGADDDFLVCRCEEVTRGEIRRARARRHLYDRRNAAVSAKRHGLMSGTDVWKARQSNYGSGAARSTGLCRARFLSCPDASDGNADFRKGRWQTVSQTADIIIIGGGIVGCAAAYYLAKSGTKRVIVLEATKSIGHGGSCRNGGGVRQSRPRCARIALRHVRHSAFLADTVRRIGR